MNVEIRKPLPPTHSLSCIGALSFHPQEQMVVTMASCWGYLLHHVPAPFLADAVAEEVLASGGDAQALQRARHHARLYGRV